jgi:hypothetical protein
MIRQEERNFHLTSTTGDEIKSQDSMCLGGTNNELVEDFVKTHAHLQNPFSPLFYWIKGQISDIKAMRDALVSRDDVISVTKKVNSKKQSARKEYENSAHGRTTLKTFFKSNNEKATYKDQLKRQMKMLENTENSYLKITAIIDSVLLREATVFKRQKIEDFS